MTEVEKQEEIKNMKAMRRRVYASILGNIPEESVDYLIDVLNDVIPRNKSVSIVEILKMLPIKTMPDIPTTEIANVVKRIMGEASLWRKDVRLVEGFLATHPSAAFLNVYTYENGYIDFLSNQLGSDELPKGTINVMINRTQADKDVEYEFSFDTMTLNRV